MFIGTPSFTTRLSVQRSVLFGAAKSIAVAIAFVAWLAIPFQAAQAQKFISLPFDEAYDCPPASIDFDEEETKDYRRKYGKILSNRKNGEKELKASARGAALSPAAKDYLTGYAFPAMTQTDPETLSKLGETRTKFLGTYLDDNVTGASRQQIIAETLKACEAIAGNKDLHPAARLNAVYLLGQLDSVPISNGSAPNPSPEALAILMKFFKGEDADLSPKYLQIAALAGIQRNIEITRKLGRQVDAGTRTELLTRINQTLADPIDPQNTAVSYWLKRRSMQVGGLIGDSATVDQIFATLNNKDESFWLQADALDALATLGTMDTSNEKNQKGLQAVSNFVSNALAREAKSIETARAQLVYDNILFQDIDLVANGTNFEGEAAAATGASGGGGGRGGGRGGEAGGRGGGGSDMGAGGMGAGGVGGGDMGAGGMGDGGMTDGGYGGGFGGGRSGGGRSAVTAATTEPQLNLPNYELQSFRSKIKTIGLKAKTAIGIDKTKGLRRYLDAKSESAADTVNTYLDRVIENSSIGIIDREDRDFDPEDIVPEVAFTQQLIDRCNEWSNDVAEALEDAGLKPAATEPATTEPAAEAAPAETPAAGK